MKSRRLIHSCRKLTTKPAPYQQKRSSVLSPDIIQILVLQKKDIAVVNLQLLLCTIASYSAKWCLARNLPLLLTYLINYSWTKTLAITHIRNAIHLVANTVICGRFEVTDLGSEKLASMSLALSSVSLRNLDWPERGSSLGQWSVRVSGFEDLGLNPTGTPFGKMAIKLSIN
ncbi:hypothetical protein VNO77_14525 [Canavalia gladiata]|uniref:Uncharacterized protein n=1 Tax=Canavalia gladiata TaxID=3824 RepID=A0AAN9M3J1_CANGL